MVAIDSGVAIAADWRTNSQGRPGTHAAHRPAVTINSQVRARRWT